MGNVFGKIAAFVEDDGRLLIHGFVNDVHTFATGFMSDAGATEQEWIDYAKRQLEARIEKLLFHTDLTLASPPANAPASTIFPEPPPKPTPSQETPLVDTFPTFSEPKVSSVSSGNQ